MTGDSWRTALLAAAALALGLGVAAVVTRPLAATMPVYLELAEALRQGPLSESFEPLGYPWLISVVVDPLALNFVMLFALPFVVTNAEPRFRLPLDAIYATSLMQLAARPLPWRDGQLPA